MVAKYAHMKEYEAQIWDRFLRVMPWSPVRVTYDLRLGVGTVLPPETPEWVRRMAYSLSTKRVDAVVETRHEVYICEVKQRAGMSALGQLLGYEALYVSQFKPRRSVVLVLICEVVEPDMESVYGQYGIQTYLV